MAILEGGHIVPPPHSSYIQKPRAIRVKHPKILFSISFWKENKTHNNVILATFKFLKCYIVTTYNATLLTIFHLAYFIYKLIKTAKMSNILKMKVPLFALIKMLCVYFQQQIKV